MPVATRLANAALPTVLTIAAVLDFPRAYAQPEPAEFHLLPHASPLSAQHFLQELCLVPISSTPFRWPFPVAGDGLGGCGQSCSPVPTGPGMVATGSRLRRSAEQPAHSVASADVHD